MSMNLKRIWHTLRLWSYPQSSKRTAYLKKHKIFASIGENCSLMDRNVPLYANLIRIGNNVHLASNVHFVVHDITHVMLNRITSNNAGGVFKSI